MQVKKILVFPSGRNPSIFHILICVPLLGNQVRWSFIIGEITIISFQIVEPPLTQVGESQQAFLSPKKYLCLITLFHHFSSYVSKHCTISTPMVKFINDGSLIINPPWINGVWIISHLTRWIFLLYLICLLAMGSFLFLKTFSNGSLKEPVRMRIDTKGGKTRLLSLESLIQLYFNQWAPHWSYLFLNQERIGEQDGRG